ncbi:MAG: alanine dehydrogenase [Saprospiraceae bacterium]|nr:alanine dehydrogenase [Saprospiraceae bacterium]
MKIAIVREYKKPAESRAPLTPSQVSFLRDELDINIVVQSYEGRCYSDEEYAAAGVPLVDDVSDCDILMGVKEVPVDKLIDKRTYLIFSHTIKKQEQNRALLRAVLGKKIRLIDYELITNTHGQRLIAFGHFAGMVGAHNALWTYGKKTGNFELPRLKDLRDYQAAKNIYKELRLPPIKIVLTGTGRVGTGALLTLKDMGIRQIDPDQYLTDEFDYPVFTQLLPHHYAAQKDGDPFDKSVFYNDPEQFESTFWPFARISDLMINGIYYVEEAPAFFTLEQMKSPEFKIKAIADISCDIAPHASIPCTFRATTIDHPVYGYDPQSGLETEPFLAHTIDMMTIDNLPNEIPREATKAFGKQFITRIMGELMKTVDHSEMLDRATIAENGHLKPGFTYLQEWVNDKSLE